MNLCSHVTLMLVVPFCGLGCLVVARPWCLTVLIVSLVVWIGLGMIILILESILIVSCPELWLWLFIYAWAIGRRVIALKDETDKWVCMNENLLRYFSLSSIDSICQCVWYWYTTSVYRVTLCHFSVSGNVILSNAFWHYLVGSGGNSGCLVSMPCVGCHGVRSPDWFQKV